MIVSMKTLVFLAVMLALPGCDEATKMCNDEAATPKFRVSACGELCDKEDGPACVKQDEVAQKACFQDKDAEICRWMCDYAKVGKELYCAEHDKLAPAAK